METSRTIKRIGRWAALGVLLSAAAAAAADLPPEVQQGAVAFVSGGIGEDEARAMQEAAHRYPLALQFVSRTGESPGAFLADIDVSIRDNRGNQVMQTRSAGPFLLARLPAGNYVVTAANEGAQRSQRVNVSLRGTRRVVFSW